MSSQNLPLQEKSAESHAKLLIIALFLVWAGSDVKEKRQSRRLCADSPASAMEWPTSVAAEVRDLII